MSDLSYEEKCLALFEQVIYDGITEAQLADKLSTWDPDDVRALALTTQAFYTTARSVWFDKTTAPKHAAT